ncbi:MAG: hypothetical protein IJ043_10560 [Clostridia bacterium]|nr:hypothetical protein [Clostridia bacterium]
MKKRIVKILALFLVICLSLSITAHAQGSIANQIEEKVTTYVKDSVSTMKELIKAEAPAKAQDGKLRSALKKSAQNSKTASENIDLNDYFGGSYLNDERILTINVTTDDPKVISAFKTAAGSENVIIRHVDYRYDDLETLSDSFYQLVLRSPSR